LNSNIYKHIDGAIRPKSKLMAVGKKGNDSLSRLFPTEYTYAIINDMKQAVHFGFASYIYENMKTVPKLNEVHVVFNRFISAGVQRQSVYTIPDFGTWIAKLTLAGCGESNKANYQFTNAVLNLDESVAKDFYDFHASMCILNAVSENEHSEYAARLLAVESQMTNIAQLQERTRYLYNKTRQGSITAALIELLSAMSAMSDSVRPINTRARFWE